MSQSAARHPDPFPDPDHDTPGELIIGPWAPAEPEPVEPPPPAAFVAPPLPAAPPRRACRCGNVTDYGHNGFTCDQVLAIRKRVGR